MPRRDLIIVGPVGYTHIAGSLAHAGSALGLPCELVDTAFAYAGPRLPRSLLWYWAGRRPYRLRAFADRLRRDLAARPPRLLIAVGHAPITADALCTLRDLGVCCVTYVTDDPWNPAHRATWHLDALPIYDVVFSPRRSNLGDFGR